MGTGLVLARKDSSVYPLDPVKTTPGKEKQSPWGFCCAPCYHKSKKKDQITSLSDEKPSKQKQNVTEPLKQPENREKKSGKLSPIPLVVQSPPNNQRKSGECNTFVGLFNPNKTFTEVSPSQRKFSDKSPSSTNFLGHETRKPLMNPQLLLSFPEKERKSHENLLNKDHRVLIKSLEHLSLDPRAGPIEKVPLKTQDSARILEESIKMGPLPEFQVSNLCEILAKNRVLDLEDSISEGFELRKIELNYQKGNSIGKGPCGKVYECLNLNSGEILAVKTINKNLVEPSFAYYFQINLLGLKHENILGYLDFGISDDPEVFELVSEYIAGGSLKNLLGKFGKFEEVVTSLFTAQILNGLRSLHSNGILHRNLKSTNCLVESNGTVKLSDYYLLPLDLSRDKNTKISDGDANSSLLDSEAGSESLNQSKISVEISQISPFDARHWMSPETYESGTFTEKSDIWSLGCIVFEMLLGQSLFTLGLKQQKTIEQYYSSVTELFPQGLSNKARDFLSLLLKKQPEDRATLDVLLAHQFLETQGIAAVGEENEEAQAYDKNGQNGFEKIGSVISKSNFSVLASLINSSIQESQFMSNKNTSKKGISKHKCPIKKIFKTGDWEKKVIEEKELERSIIAGETADSIQRKKRVELEKNLKADPKKLSLIDFGSPKKNSSMDSNAHQKSQQSVDFNAQKRKEFEENLLKEIAGVSCETNTNKSTEFVASNKEVSSFDYNAKKRMEFEQKLLQELAGA